MVAHKAHTAQAERWAGRVDMTDLLRDATSAQCMAQRCPRAGQEPKDPLALGQQRTRALLLYVRYALKQWLPSGPASNESRPMHSRRTMGILPCSGHSFVLPGGELRSSTSSL